MLFKGEKMEVKNHHQIAAYCLSVEVEQLNERFKDFLDQIAFKIEAGHKNNPNEGGLGQPPPKHTRHRESHQSNPRRQVCFVCKKYQDTLRTCLFLLHPHRRRTKWDNHYTTSFAFTDVRV